MNIGVSVCEVDKADSLYVNPAVPQSVQREVRDLFCEKYLYPKRPSEPKHKAEIALTLRDHNPFHSTPRRLSYSEKSQVAEILDKWLENAVIRPSKCEYALPIVLVERKWVMLGFALVIEHSISTYCVITIRFHI